MILGLLECDHVDDRFRGIGGDYRDMFAALFDRWELKPYDAVSGVLPESPAECDAWVITGSRYSVYHHIPWLDELSAFVRRVQAAATPCAGVCFGHQLLAHTLGGRVQQAASGWGVGRHMTLVSDAQPWMDPHLAECALLYMHQDQVVDLPRGGQVLGRTDHCPVAMMQLGPTIVGVQAHPEFAPAYVAALLEARAAHIPAETLDAAARSLDDPIDGRVVGAWLSGFLEGGLR